MEWWDGLSSYKQQLCMGGMGAIIQSAPSKLLFLISSFLLTTVHYKKQKYIKDYWISRFAVLFRLLIILILKLSKTNLFSFYSRLGSDLILLCPHYGWVVVYFCLSLPTNGINTTIKKNCIKLRKNTDSF